jgi:tRNA pseudouridine13 synthase
MKLKQQPDDFQVEELTDVTPAAGGRYALYRLEKRAWSTPDAIEALRRRWHLDARRVSFGGLKDRHAQTVQYLTIWGGPPRNLVHDRIEVTYLGWAGEPYTASSTRGNHFRIVLRDVTRAEKAAAVQALEEVRADGLPNYFDDQRFGSVGNQPEFVARLLVQGQFEEALRLALTTPYPHDRAAAKKEKAILRACWGDWSKCRARLTRSRSWGLLDYLARHPGDYRGAVARLQPEAQGFYLSVYQSYLWNRILARWIDQHYPAEQLVQVRLRLGRVPMHRRLSPEALSELADALLPLPSARCRLEAGDPRLPVMESVLADEGLRLADLKVKGLRKPFFSRGERAVLCLPVNLEYRLAADEHHPGREKLMLSFELGRGSYATLIIKRVQQAAAESNVTQRHK